MAIVYLPDGSQEWYPNGSEELLQYASFRVFDDDVVDWWNTPFPYQLPNAEVCNKDIVMFALYLFLWNFVAATLVFIHHKGVATIQGHGKDLLERFRKGSLWGIVVQSVCNTVLLVVLWFVGGIPFTDMVLTWCFGTWACNIFCLIHAFMWSMHFEMQVKADKSVEGSSSELAEKGMLQGPCDN